MAAAILAADADIALLTEFRVGKGGDRLLNALAVGSLTEIIAGPPAAGAFPYTVAVASRLAVEAADYPLRKSPLQMASKGEESDENEDHANGDARDGSREAEPARQ